MNDTTQNIKNYFNTILSIFIATIMLCCGSGADKKHLGALERTDNLIDYIDQNINNTQYQSNTIPNNTINKIDDLTKKIHTNSIIKSKLGPKTQAWIDSIKNDNLAVKLSEFIHNKYTTDLEVLTDLNDKEGEIAGLINNYDETDDKEISQDDLINDGIDILKKNRKVITTKNILQRNIHFENDTFIISQPTDDTWSCGWVAMLNLLKNLGLSNHNPLSGNLLKGSISNTIEHLFYYINKDTFKFYTREKLYLMQKNRKALILIQEFVNDNFESTRIDIDKLTKIADKGMKELSDYLGEFSDAIEKRSKKR